jgi:hypothetical protein
MNTTAGPACDMVEGCTAEIAYLDEAGYIYCAPHGIQRQQDSWKRCRKLRPHELNRLRRGQQVERY